MAYQCTSGKVIRNGADMKFLRQRLHTPKVVRRRPKQMTELLRHGI